MTDHTTFESRKGTLTCSPQELFNFATDIRNFSRFIPEGTVTNLLLETERCSFTIPPLGNISMSISKKDPFSKVSYEGTIFGSNEFSLILNIGENQERRAEVKVRLEAVLNPILKMMASQYVERFLETLIEGMEKFRDWKEY